jgi:hypothetical protein
MSADRICCGGIIGWPTPPTVGHRKCPGKRQYGPNAITMSLQAPCNGAINRGVGRCQTGKLKNPNIICEWCHSAVMGKEGRIAVGQPIYPGFVDPCSGDSQSNSTGVPALLPAWHGRTPSKGSVCATTRGRPNRSHKKAGSHSTPGLAVGLIQGIIRIPWRCRGITALPPRARTTSARSAGRE